MWTPKNKTNFPVQNAYLKNSPQNVWQKVPGKWPYPSVSFVKVPDVNIHSVGDSHKTNQFLISTSVSTRGHEPIFPQILVDTGAQPNLVKRGLFPQSLFRRASNPIFLASANKGKN
jgi:hypothetical protein